MGGGAAAWRQRTGGTPREKDRMVDAMVVGELAGMVGDHKRIVARKAEGSQEIRAAPGWTD